MLSKIFNIVVFLILIFVYNNVYSNTSISLESNKTSLVIGENFTVIVETETNYTGSIDVVSIEGVNTFLKVGQKISNNLSIINGQSLSVFKLHLLLSGNKDGEYVIGPAKLQVGDDIILSNTLKILINKDNVLNVEKNNNHLSNNNKNKDEDIRGIKNPDNSFLWFIFFQVIVLFLLVGLYIYSKIYIKDDFKYYINNKDLIFQKKQKILKELNLLLEKNDIYSKSYYYKQLNILFRKYINVLGIKNSEILTLSEIKELNLNKTLVILYEKSYLNEFNNMNDNNEGKNEIVKKLINIIK